MLKKITASLKKGYIIIFSAVMIMLLLHTAITSAGQVYTGKPATIAHDFLDLEKGFGANSRHFAIIEKLINKAISKIVVKADYATEEAVQLLMTIDFLLREEGYVFKNNYLLFCGLDKKELDCDNYCALYIAIAEVMKIPIIPAYAPNHAFLRFSFSDGTYLNWETTQSVTRPDSYYIKSMNIPEESIKNGVYMQSLTRKEFIALEYNNIGAHLMSIQKFSEAIAYFNTAIKLYPNFSSAFHNRGTSHYALKLTDRALADLLMADSLDPSRASTHNTLGDIYLDRKKYELAMNEYATSIKLDPENWVPYNSMAIIKNLQGKEDESQEWLKKSKEIKEKQKR